ncbi:MAG: chromosome segregation protein SMC [Synergistaceae bacterium]|nr:chromosome segregation protein SMC [Synergistaceae bacterium]
MSIEYLRLKGFKSFGTACEFSFSEGLTAIVGPNGSGKSNILDALRWIFGEGSPGALRIVRQSDLIFQGSATVDASKEAEVVLKLKQKDASDPSSVLTAVLRRQYTAESGSVLQVDGVKIKLQDLADFKARFMLEGDSFAFIGQGEIAEVIHQRPMQRRHHLELLFGIDRYRKRREETYYKLEATQSELTRIQTLTSELEARREEIAPEVAVAVEAKGIIDNLENIRRDFYFSKRLSLEGKEREYRQQSQLAAENRDTAAGWKNLWARSIAATEEKMRSEGFDEKRFLAREQELAARKDSLRRQSFSAATRVKGILSDRRELDAEAERVSAELAAVKAEMEKNQGEEAALGRELEAKRGAFEETLRRLEESRETAEREYLRRQALQDEHAEKTLLRSKQEARLKALLASKEESGRDLLRLRDEQAALTAMAAKLTEEVAALESRHEKLSLDYSDIYAACQKHAAGLQQMKRELVSQEAELDAVKENTGASIYPEPTRRLLAASRLGRMKSRPEVVAEVFSCPSEAAPALEAYLGGRQFWLLVHTLDEAQEGIELLKQARAGRVTYLPLERCRPRFPDPRFRLPPSGVVGWGIELITARAPWEPAMQHLLGDLLVVREYALGSRMVKEGAKFPIVTLEGEVFSPAGTVTGGRTRQSEGAISRNQKMAELSLHIDALKRKIKELETEFSRAEKQEQKAAAEREELGAALIRKKNELLAAQKNAQAAAAEIERIGGEDSASGAEVSALETDLSVLGTRLAELGARLAEMRELAEPGGELPSFVSAARGEVELAEERLRGVANILARIRRERENLETRLTAARESLEAGRAEDQALKRQLSRFGREHLTVWRELETLRKTLAEERSKAGRIHSRLQRLRAREQKAEANLTALAAEIAALNEREAAARAEALSLQEQWEEKYPYDAREAAQIEGGKDLTAAMRRLERELRALGAYNLGALSEDESLTERIDYLSDQSEDVRAGIKELETLIAETDEQVETLFTQKMNGIDDRFNALFQRLFAGGEARLTLQEARLPQDGSAGSEGTIWDRGVEIYARPPGKRLQNISQLSGGEQSLTAVAHLFAALEVARMPLAVLDEVDAALDEYNLIRFADLAKEYSKRLQLLVMTHRRTTMERADLIYGVTMVEPGLSKIVGIDMENYK